jgi:hypothetical protein
MAIIIDFKTRKVLNSRDAYVCLHDSYKSRCGTFDYNELAKIVDRAEKAHGRKAWEKAIGINSSELWLRLNGKKAFSLAEIESLIAFLGIPDAEVSRVFFKPYGV